MNLVVGVEGVEVLGLVKIPEHGGTVLATGGAQGTVGGDGDGVDVAGVTNVVGLELAGRELPNLYQMSEPCQMHKIGRVYKELWQVKIRAMVNSGLMACVNRL
jgi:hypothetical protein